MARQKKTKETLLQLVTPESAAMSTEFNKSLLRTYVKSYSQIQKVRVQVGNRIVANIRVRLGIQPSTDEEKAMKDVQKMLKQVREAYSRVTDGLIANRNIDFAGLSDKLIADRAEYFLVGTYENMIAQEDALKKVMGKLIQMFPIWTEFMSKVPGCGPWLAAVIISELDPKRANYASSFVKYAGLDVVVNKDGIGEGRNSYGEGHLVPREFKDRSGNIKVANVLSHNRFLKSKLVFVLTASMIKQSARLHKMGIIPGPTKYVRIYQDYLHRIKNTPRFAAHKPIHLINMARRYMVKIFLYDLWSNWRELEGLPVTKPYHEAKLGMVHTTDYSLNPIVVDPRLLDGQDVEDDVADDEGEASAEDVG